MVNRKFEYQQIRRVTSVWEDEQTFDDVLEDGLEMKQL